jgi:HJR/Mrr/RecB family endonuclease
MYVSKINNKSTQKSQDFGAKVVSMLERSFNRVAVAA